VNEPVFLQTLGMMIVMSGVLLVIARKLAVPSIVLFIFAGLLLGPVFGLIDLTSAFGAGHAEGVSGVIALMSELGIALLLFLVGLELSLDRIKDVGKVAVAAGLGQVVFTAAIGFGISMLLGFTAMESFFLATALTFSSTVVVVKLLGQKKEIHSLYGRIAVGIFLVQDLVVIVALTFLAGLGSGEGSSGQEMATNLGLAFGGMLLMLIGALAASRYLLPKPFEWASRSPEMLFIWSLTLCFGFVLAAEVLSLSPEIGAFLAGVSLAQLDSAHDLIRRLQPLMNFFIAVFFVTLGAQMQLSEATSQLFPAIVLALFVLIGNPLIFIIIISRFGYSEKTSFKTSVTVAQISEFSFVFAAMGLSTGLIGESILAVIAVVGLVTIVLSSYMILYSDPLYEFCRNAGILKVFRASQKDDEEPNDLIADHIIVIGMNTLGRQIVQNLMERGEKVLAIDTDVMKLEGLDSETMIGNVEYLQVMEEAGYDRAKLIVSTLQIEDTNNLVAYYARQSRVPCAIHGFDATVHDDLRALGVTYLIDSKQVGMARLTAKVRDLEALA